MDNNLCKQNSGGTAMETAAMGEVTTEATIESMRDLYAAQAGILTPAKVRRVTVPDAVVDTGRLSCRCPSISSKNSVWSESGSSA